MESNKNALTILLLLVLASLAIFFMEKKFLIAEPRGQALSHYDKIPWLDKILYLVEDFEGFRSVNSSTLEKNSFFAYGNAKISLNQNKGKDLLGSKTSLMAEWKGNEAFGGWGKGVGAKIDLDETVTFLNFRILIPKGSDNNDLLKIIMEEDDNENGALEKDMDDTWFYKLPITAKDEWQFISIPIKDFTDENQGGDHIFNVTSKGGLHNLIFSFEKPGGYPEGKKWYFDFICFTNEKVNGSIPVNN